MSRVKHARKLKYTDVHICKLSLFVGVICQHIPQAEEEKEDETTSTNPAAAPKAPEAVNDYHARWGFISMVAYCVRLPIV